MWGPEIEMKALEGSLWGPESSQQAQGYRPDRPVAYAGTIREFASSLEVIAKNAILANIELEAYAEELMRERDEAWGTYQREIGAKSIVDETNADLRAQLAEQSHQVKLLNGIVTGLHYQVTMARNSALLDVEQAVRAMYPKYGGAALDAVCAAIRELNSYS